MAKGKHSAALFEVIKGAKHSEDAELSLRTPKWWFKGRQTPGVAPAAPPTFVEPQAPPASSPAQAQAPQPGVARPIGPRPAGGRSSNVQFAFDGDRKEITLRLRYTTALVSAFGVCMLIGMSYVIGRHLSRGPQVASASEQPVVHQTSQLPIQRNVTDVTRQHTGGQLPPEPPPQPRRHSDQQGNLIRQGENPHLSLVPEGADTRMPRTMRLNYAIIQTYPPEEAAAAETARDFLTRNGIPCTLEHTSWAPNKGWICLVGTAGFEHITSPEYRTYISNIKHLAEGLHTSRFNRLDPQPYSWR